MKTSVITDEFRQRYLENPADPMAFEGTAVVFDGPEDYHARIDDPKTKITAQQRARHPRRRPGGLPRRGRGGEHARAVLPAEEGRDARCPASATAGRAGTSGSPSILNASPEAATSGGLALLKSGDKVRIDLKKRTADMLVGDRGAGARAARR